MHECIIFKNTYFLNVTHIYKGSFFYFQTHARVLRTASSTVYAMRRINLKTEVNVGV